MYQTPVKSFNLSQMYNSTYAVRIRYSQVGLVLLGLVKGIHGLCGGWFAVTET